MTLRSLAPLLLAVVLVSAACGPGADAPKVPSADSVNSIVVMTRVPDEHPEVTHIESPERIADIVDFVTRELEGWQAPESDDSRLPTTSAAFEDEDGQVLFLLFIGKDWVGADDDALDSASDLMAPADAATITRLTSLFTPGGA